MGSLVQTGDISDPSLVCPNREWDGDGDPKFNQGRGQGLGFSPRPRPIAIPTDLRPLFFTAVLYNLLRLLNSCKD